MQNTKNTLDIQYDETISDECYISDELRFLINCSCKRIEDSKKKLIREMLDGDIDSNKLTKEAEKNRLYSIANYNLHRLGLDQDAKVAGITKAAKKYDYLSMILVRELVSVMKKFQEKNIDALLLKGPILAQILYGNIALRPSRDLDICVKREQFEEAYQVLESLGYKNKEGLDTPKRKRYFFTHLHQHHAEMFNGEVLIELHWRAAEYVDCTFEEITQENRRMIFAGLQLRIPDQIPYLYYLISHGSYHGFYRIRWLMDILEILVSEDAPDIQELDTYFKDKHCEFLLLYTFLYMEKLSLLDNPIIEADPKEMQDAMRLLNESWKFRLDDSDETLEYRYVHFFESVMESRGIRDYRSVWDRLQLGPELFKSFDLPDTYFWLYYIIRPLWWIWKKLPFSGEKNDTRSIRELLFKHGKD